jgi:hypothetical protein
MSKRFLFLFLGLTVLSAVRARGESMTHRGIAKNGAGKVVYIEHHTITSLDGVLKSSETDYYGPDRNTKIATLRSDYARSRSMPTYEFVDLRSNYREGMRYLDGRYVVYYQKPKEAEKAKNLREGESLFSCQGWHYYLIENLNVLEQQDIALNLVLPSELDFYSFKIQRTATDGNMIVANLELSNWLLSFFVPKLRLTYDKQQKKIVEYQGISNILGENGNRQEVTIHYEYGGERG